MKSRPFRDTATPANPCDSAGAAQASRSRSSPPRVAPPNDTTVAGVMVRPILSAAQRQQGQAADNLAECEWRNAHLQSGGSPSTSTRPAPTMLSTVPAPPAAGSTSEKSGADTADANASAKSATRSHAARAIAALLRGHGVLHAWCHPSVSSKAALPLEEAQNC